MPFSWKDIVKHIWFDCFGFQSLINCYPVKSPWVKRKNCKSKIAFQCFSAMSIHKEMCWFWSIEDISIISEQRSWSELSWSCSGTFLSGLEYQHQQYVATKQLKNKHIYICLLLLKSQKECRMWILQTCGLQKSFIKSTLMWPNLVTVIFQIARRPNYFSLNLSKAWTSAVPIFCLQQGRYYKPQNQFRFSNNNNSMTQFCVIEEVNRSQWKMQP